MPPSNALGPPEDVEAAGPGQGASGKDITGGRSTRGNGSDWCVDSDVIRLGRGEDKVSVPADTPAPVVLSMLDRLRGAPRANLGHLPPGFGPRDLVGDAVPLPQRDHTHAKVYLEDMRRECATGHRALAWPLCGSCRGDDAEAWASITRWMARNPGKALPLPEDLPTEDATRAFLGLDNFLAIEDEDPRYRIGHLWPTGGRIVLAAPAKAGKSSTVGNVLRSLADGEPFLGTYAVEPTRRVALIDLELDERTLRRWLADQGIRNRDAVTVAALRGRAAAFDILDPTTRARWAEVLRALAVETLVFDCLRPVLDALGLSEDKEAGRFLVAFDALLAEAGVSEALIVHHAGHGSERSRGDSRLIDWPDATWKIVRESDDPASARYFSAYGRDVDVPESRLTFDPATRRLTLAGGSRKDRDIDAALDDLLDLLATQPDGLSGRAIEQALPEHRQRAVRDAVRRAERERLTTTVEGPRRSKIHRLNPLSASVRRSALPVRQRTQSECVSASMDDALHSHALNDPSASVRGQWSATSDGAA